MSHLQNHSLPKSKPKYLFVGLGTMGFPMAGHLSKNTQIDLFIYNRTPSVSKNWFKKYKGSNLDLLELNNIKFDGVITCLKDDSSIIEILLNKSVIESIRMNGFILDHSTTSLTLISTICSYNYVKENKIDLLIVDYPKLSMEEITLFDDIINVIHHKSHCHLLTTKSS